MPFAVYRSTEDDSYMSKQEALLKFFNVVFEEFPFMNNQVNSDQLYNVFAKASEALSSTYEFVESSKFEKVRPALHSAVARFSDTATELAQRNNLDRDAMRGSVIVTSCQDVLQTHRLVFQPESSIHDLEVPRIVRLFIDGDEKFVMQDEMKWALNRTRSTAGPTDNLLTYSGELPFQMAAKCQHPIEFLKVPINKPKTIISPSGRLCKLAGDAFLEIVGEYNYSATLIHPLIKTQVLRDLQQLFPPTKFEGPRYFVSQDKIEMLKEKMRLNCKCIACSSKSLQAFREKMAHLMEDNEEYKPFLFLFEFPEMERFIHNQKSCHRVPWRSCCSRSRDSEKAKQFACVLTKIIDDYVKDRDGESKEKRIEGKNSTVTTESEVKTIAKQKKRNRRKNKSKTGRDAVGAETSEVVDGVLKVLEDHQVQEIAEGAVLEAVGPMKSATVLPTSESRKSRDSLESQEKSNDATAETSKPMPEEPETVVESPTESTSDCRKCFRTSEYCEKAKEQLKTSQNTVKRLEKKQSETEKLMESMKKKMQEEMDALRLQLEEMKNTNEQQRLENQKQIEELKKENGELKEENSKLKEAVKEEEPQPTEPEVSEPPMTREERREMIFDLRNKENELRCSNLWKDADLKVLKLITTKPDVQKMAQNEHINFKIQFNNYEEAIQTALQAILNNDKITRSQVPALPVYPALSERFKTEYNKMLVDEKNKELENECFCLEPLDEKDHENLFTCPACNKSNHLECTEEWFKKNPTCPCCRAEWK